MRKPTKGSKDKQPRGKQRVSQKKFLALGIGKVGYIKIMQSDDVMKRYPRVQNLPRGITVFGLYEANGNPIAIVDTKDGAMGHARRNSLRIQALH